MYATAADIPHLFFISFIIRFYSVTGGLEVPARDAYGL